MPERSLRVNELVRRHLSILLRRHYQHEAVAITLLAVKVSRDLRSARVHYSVVGNEATKQQAERFFKLKANALRHLLGKAIVLKYLPSLQFFHDDSLERSVKVLDILDQLPPAIEEGTQEPEVPSQAHELSTKLAHSIREALHEKAPAKDAP